MISLYYDFKTLRRLEKFTDKIKLFETRSQFLFHMSQAVLPAALKMQTEHFIVITIR